MKASWAKWNPLPGGDDAEAEANKVAWIRIAAGLLLCWRCFFIARDSLYYFASEPAIPPQFPVAAVEFGLALGLALGVAPAVCALLLALSHAAFSIWTGTYNLCPMLLVPLLAGLAALEGGRWSLKCAPRTPRPASHYRAFYLVLFLSYAALSFQAVLYHVRDSYWIEGRTPAVLFASSYLSRFYRAFRWIELLAPNGVWGISRFIVGFQTIFQFGMIPLVWNRFGQRFVLVWGAGFILISLLDLNLSLLPWLEALYWGAIFAPATWFPQSAPTERTSARPSLRIARLGFVGYLGIYGCLLVLFLTNAVQFAASGALFPSWLEDKVLFYSGLVAPNVFNREDLAMGDHWAVVERLLPGGRWETVPFDGPDGERLSYHRSDLLYFGNSLPWRRSMIDVADLEAFHRPGNPGFDYARRLVEYDHRRFHPTQTVVYRVTLFGDQASEHREPTSPDRFKPIRLFSFDLTVQPESS